MPQRTAAIIGGGPAGLFAAERLSAADVAVTLYDRMPSVGRKFLMAGRGGLNLTHSEPFDAFVWRYAETAPWMRPLLEAFPPDALTAWAEGLDQPVFTGSSGRIFPKAMKASPLLRAWLARLAAQGVIIRTRHDWQGWDGDGALVFDTPGGHVTARADATLLALGGASWPRLGADGSWVDALKSRSIGVTPLRPSNAGFTVAWTDVFASRFAGQPLKGIALSFAGHIVRGEAMITDRGIEGGAIYALSASLRNAINGAAPAILTIDLRPDMTASAIEARLQRSAHGQSRSNMLRKALNLSPVAANLLREGHGDTLAGDASNLAAAIKAVPLSLTGMQGLDRAISTAGGVAVDQMDTSLMLKSLPGVFAAGEMLDWEAPTGGYLLQACFATGMAAANGMRAFLGSPDKQKVLT